MKIIQNLIKMEKPSAKINEVDFLSLNDKALLLKNNLKLIKKNEIESGQKRSVIEENFKLKGLEKLEKNMLRNKSQAKSNKASLGPNVTGLLSINSINNNIVGNNKLNCLNSNNNESCKESNFDATYKSSKSTWKIIDDEILDNPEFRKTLKNEKIEIKCPDMINSEKTVNNNCVKEEESICDNLKTDEIEYMDLHFFIEEYNDIYTFLEDIGMHEKYFFDFINDGWDDLDSLILIEQANLDLMVNLEEKDKKIILSKIEALRREFLNNRNKNNSGDAKLSHKSSSNKNSNNPSHNFRNLDFNKEKEQRLQFQKSLNEYRKSKKEKHDQILIVIAIL